MRTRIYLERNELGEWDPARGHIDVNHENPLTMEEADAFRAVAHAAIAADLPEPVRACPPREPMSQR